MSITDTLYNSGVSGLGFLGDILDTPGSFARGLLAGQPLRAIGGIVAPSYRVSERELAHIPDDPTSWWDDIGALGVGILTDPLTYVGGVGIGSKIAGRANLLPKAVRAADGALIKGAREAAAGTTLRQLAQSSPQASEAVLRATGGLKRGLWETVTGAPTYADQAVQMGRDLASGAANSLLDQPLRRGSYTLGSLDILGGTKNARNIDMLGEAIRYDDWKIPLSKLPFGGMSDFDLGVNPIRAMAPIFSKAANNSPTKFGQILGGDLLGIEDEAIRSTRADMFGAADAWRQNENALNAAQYDITDYMELDTPLPNEISGYKPHLDNLRTMMEQEHVHARSLGLPRGNIDDPTIEYFPRTITDQPHERGFQLFNRTDKAAPVATQSAKSRSELFERTPRRQASDMSTDPDIPVLLANSNRSNATQTFAEKLRTHYGYQDFDDQLYQQAKAKGPKSLAAEVEHFRLEAEKALKANQIQAAQVYTANADKAEEMLRQLDVFDRSYDTAGMLLMRAAEATANGGVIKPIFNTSPLEDYSRYLTSVRRSNSTADLLLDRIAGVAKPIDISALPMGTAHNEYVSINDALAGAGFARNGSTTKKAVEEFARRKGINIADVGKYSLSKEHADEFSRVIDRINNPEPISKAMRFVDDATGVWKSLALMRPTFPFRNYLGGQGMNILNQASSSTANSAIDDILAGRVVRGIAGRIPQYAGMTDAQATDELRKFLFTHGITDKKIGELKDVPGIVGEEITKNLPGHTPITGAEAAGKFFSPFSGKYRRNNPEWYNPLKIQSITGEDPKFFAEQATNAANFYTEAKNRGGMAIEYLMQGVDPDEAARLVRESHVDYNNLSTAERNYIRKLMPFYSYQRGMLPWTAKELVNNPGGNLSKTLRGINVLHGDQPLPEQVADTAAIPLGVDSEGNRRFAVGLGFMPEDSLRVLGTLSPFGGGGFGKEFGKQLTPVIKGPIEMATGRSLFYGGKTGRDLADAEPILGGISKNILGGEAPDSRFLDSILVNALPTPLTTVKTVTDPNRSIFGKATQLLTGIRSVSVKPGTSDAIVRENLEADLKRIPGSKRYEKVYVNKETLSQLPEVERRKASEVQEMLRILGERAKSRAREKVKPS